ncbi:fructose-bisphosphate aldolase [Candidatus Woesearchaeota archaeon]|nr:fructose-bisphosphate aldolase [Candidatus Woesearchaeota archaeon]
MLASQLDKIFHNGKSVVLAYDQGLEHGPKDFDERNINPDYILDIAEKGCFKGLVLHHGIAEKYYGSIHNVPLIVKLNGKTNIPQMEPYSEEVCTVKRAVSLGADLVGYTIYVGSEHEHRMFKRFGWIVNEAHHYGIPVVAWVYPRGKYVADPLSTETLAYAARVGLELGADVIKINYHGDLNGFKWVVKAAGKAKVLVAGGSKMDDHEFLQKTYEIMQAGASGLAVGRNVWQHQDPLRMADRIKKIVFENKRVDEVL